ncbi:hypothetical protein [Oribacterium sp. P6A1]|uniref:hypothetical protein n=1 Tax=Oribacterium sp. P6A1 TaxID=1410612 RepID=UPI0005614FE5|nr:hypothetical protein [Oribacterium sp. P6A1]
MGRFNDILDQFSDDNPLSMFTKILGGNVKDEDNVRHSYGNQPLWIYDISGEEIKELQPEDRIYVRTDSVKNKILVEASDGEGKATVITACDVSQNANDQKEISNMMNTLVQDISRARRNGAEGITVPVNEYELVAYIRNRPSIEIDLDRLEDAINHHRKDEVLSDFVNDLHQNKRVDIYTAANNIYNAEAAHILKTEFAKFSNIHFYDLNESYNHMVYWNDEVILNNIKFSPEAVIIGIGLAGEKPVHAISIRNDIHSSVIKKISFMVNHAMNVREEMLDAQFVKHAMGIEEIARNRNMSEEVKNKVLIELAIAEAKYRYDDLRINEFLKAVIDVYYTEGQMKMVKVPFNDPNLIMNLIPDAMSGLLVEIGDNQIIYYGFDSSAKLLIDKYRWIDMGYGRAGHDASRANMKQFEKQASDMTLRTRYISEMNNVLIGNESRSANASYKYVRDVAVKYKDIGLDAENQIELLQEVPVINDPSYRTSIENIIKETITKESPFRMFGEIRKGAKPRKNRQE